MRDDALSETFAALSDPTRRAILERLMEGPAPVTDLAAPFDVSLVPINLQRSDTVREASETLYAELQELGLDVLYDDRDVRPGVKFADAELIGIPHRLVVSERGLAAGELEYRHRSDSEARNLSHAEALELLQE